MQIVKQTSSELSLRNQPSRLSKGFIGLWALLFSGIPLVIMGAWIYNLGVTQLSCQRVEPSQVMCDRTQTRLLGFMPGPTSTFDQVTAATMKTSAGADSDGVRTVDHWVVLQTSNGEATYIEDPIRINGRKGSPDEMQAITDQINEFLASDQASVSMQRDLRFRLGNSIFPLGFMGLFVLIGSTVVYFSFRSEELVFDKNTRQFRCSRQTLLGSKTWQCPLNEIQDVIVDVQIDSDGDPTYALKLIPQQGKRALIPGSKSHVEAACNTIRNFLQSSSPIGLEGYAGSAQA
ncbi:hypothetical protein [Leptothoe spongobia]|uniref:Transmembrane protein n=1 Tax=Leptothoe spongobia TAU-MAC 1115 TaxID=1967444 RepID=A0A947GEJ4_9CYAN|nr:hypothetical protein [Leptothoe spongobia]MBT9313960.1 hypothetical protein [Leptothoe spongobia TAU-MAC 1115]